MLRNQIKDQILEQKIPLYSYHLGIYKGFGSSLPRISVTDQYIFFYYLTDGLSTSVQRWQLSSYVISKEM